MALERISRAAFQQSLNIANAKTPQTAPMPYPMGVVLCVSASRAGKMPALTSHPPNKVMLLKSFHAHRTNLLNMFLILPRPGSNVESAGSGLTYLAQGDISLSNSTGATFARRKSSRLTNSTIAHVSSSPTLGRRRGDRVGSSTARSGLLMPTRDAVRPVRSPSAASPCAALTVATLPSLLPQNRVRSRVRAMACPGYDRRPFRRS